MKQAPHRRSSGFTIIELAVVVAVIGILVSIALFGFQRVQMQARDTKRATDVRTLVEGLERYYVRNGEYPVDKWGSENPSVWASVIDVTNPDILGENTTLSSLRAMFYDTNIPDNFLDPQQANSNYLFSTVGIDYSGNYLNYGYSGGGTVFSTVPDGTYARDWSTYSLRRGDVVCTMVYNLNAADTNKAVAPMISSYSEVDDLIYFYIPRFGIKPVVDNFKDPNCTSWSKVINL